MLNTTSGFPSIAEKEKGRSYHERWVRAIVSSTFTESWANNYQVLEMLYKYYHDGSSAELSSHLQVAPDGSSLPAVWMSLNGLKSNLDLLVGEMEKRGYEIKVKAISKEAISRKLEEKERLRAERHLRPVAKYAESLTGMPLQNDEHIPSNDKELDEYMDLSFKDKVEIIFEHALDFIAEYSNWSEKRKALFRDILIVNRCIVRNEIIRGVPQARRVDPLKFIFDPNSTDDALSDSTFFGEVEYMPLAAAAERYGLTMDEIERARNSYEEYLGMANTRGDSDFASAFGFMPGQRLRWFKIIDGTPRCLVIRSCWRDVEELAHKSETVDKETGKAEFFQDVTGKPVRERDKEKIVYNKIEMWRQGTIIGGSIFREWGPCENQPRDLSRIEKSLPPYQVLVPNFLMSRSVSKLEQLVPLQLLKDMAMYHVQIAMAKAAGKVLAIDMAMMPDGWTKEQVMGHVKTDGIVWLNSKEYMMQFPGQMANLFKEYDLTLSDSLGQYFTIMNYLDSQIASISGVSPERQGIVQGSSQAVGVTQSALFQSNLVTAPYFEAFERFCARVLNYQAKLVRISWANNEVFAPIIGDTGINFLEDNVDLDLEEVGVYVHSAPPIINDRQALQQKLDIYLQSCGGDPQCLADVLAIELEPDTKSAIRKFQRLINNRVKLQQQQAAQQQQQEANQQYMAQQLQAKQAELASQTPLELQGMKNQGQRENTLIKTRGKLVGDKMKILNQPRERVPS